MSLKSMVTGRDVEVLEFSEHVAEPDAPVDIQIPVNNGPISGIALSRDGRRLLVTNYGSDSVSIIDTSSFRVVDAVDGVDEPFSIALGGDDRAYVSTVSASYDAIQVIDLTTNTVVGTHPLALSVSDLTVSADGKRVYATRSGIRGADVAILDTETERVEVVEIANTSGVTTECVRVSPDGSRLYVGVNAPSGGQLVVIDTGVATDEAETVARARWRRKTTRSKNAKQAGKSGPTVIATIEIGLALRDVAISPNGGLVYAASSGPEFSVIDVVDTRTNKIAGTRKIAEVSGLLTRLTLSGDGERAYLVSDDSVTMLCTLTQDVIDSVNVATQPSCVVESPNGKYLYIADYSGTVTVAPIAAGDESGVEQTALESKRSVDLFVPELLQYDAALV
ncbi:hypothetical protein A5634_02135 [Mycobacterium asiaticum]|uniref:SMP-30/Gluconolactonase/LRE-like region domain-containing protein n=1 Tax=Mycobacterium asiaticum TaxID=1790 RepID=A0A1A3NXN6_MYCAS|nr:YncE family protein [Mycobacterium asiaticum]OBK25102.1 hypothetical protein A5634_02135 [Mycobacterium asiaticum]